MKRGEIWWADLDEPSGSEPGYRHPVLIIQADAFNSSRIRTIIVALISSNLKLADAPGNILLTHTESNLPKDSVINVSQLLTLDRSYFSAYVETLKSNMRRKVDVALQTILGLHF